MNFYIGGTQGGLVIYLMEYQHLLKYGMPYDDDEKPLGQEILTVKHANYKLTDAVVGVDYYNPEWNGFVINQRLKSIIDEYKLPEHLRYSVKLEYKKQHYNYSILYFDRPKLLNKYRTEAINYEMSIFTNEKNERLEANNWQELESYPDGFYIRELYLYKNNIDYDIFPNHLSSPYSTGDNLYLISERLKLRLEKEKITGLEWSEPLNAPWLKIV
jgi:hypothetical protein